MFRGFRWLALVGVVVTAALVGPSVALADCSGTSSVNIYVECVPNAKGGSHPTKAPAKPVTVTPTVTTPYVVQPPPYVPPARHHNVAKEKREIKRAIGHVGNEMRPVQAFLANRLPAGYVDSVLADSPTKANAGSTFDLGTGPSVFFILLLGTVLLLLGTGGVRSWRNRHRV